MSNNMTYWAAPDLYWNDSDVVEWIIKTVCNKQGVSTDTVKRKGRTRHVVETRQLCMYFILKYTNQTLVQTGRTFYECHHSTVIHARQKINDMYDTEKVMRDLIDNFDSVFSGMKQIKTIKKQPQL